MRVQFQDGDIICFQRHTKNAIFQNETIDVKPNPMNSLQRRKAITVTNGVQNVHRRVRQR